MLSLAAPPPPPASTSLHSSLHLPNGRSLLLYGSSSWMHAVSISAAGRDLPLTASLHASAIKSGLLPGDLFIANALLDAYAKCGHMGYADDIFDQMPERDIVSWSSLMYGYCHNGSAITSLSIFVDLISSELAPSANEFTLATLSQAAALMEDGRMGKAVHGYFLKSRFSDDAFICNSLIGMYSKLGLQMSAEKLLYGLHKRDLVSWSAIISGCVRQNMFIEAIHKFIMMLEDGILPNVVTLLSIIKTCSLMNQPMLFGWVHAWISKLQLGSNDFVVNSLVEMYSKNGFLHEGIQAFIQIWCIKGSESLDPIAMAAIIHACAVSGSLWCAKAFHGLFLKQSFLLCTFLENSLIDMYGKLHHLDSANNIFRRMKERNIVSWNSMISSFLKNNYPTKTLELLSELHLNVVDELAPDSITMSSSIQACAELASLQHGEMLHGYVVKSGFDADLILSNALIDMYAKSGKIEFSEKIFNSMDQKDLGTWNIMIQAYGIHGDGKAALRTFHELKKYGFLKPSSITFANVITACSHSGLVSEGYECFKSMQRDFGIEPDMEHYASVVYLFARSGKLVEAEDFIREMPIEPGSAVWSSLLGACGTSGHVEVAERAAEKVSLLEADDTAWKVSLSNAYANAGRWENAARVRSGMKKEGGRKEAGWSSVEVNHEKSWRFMVGDTKHPQADKIYEVWNCLKQQMKAVPEEC